MAHPAFGKLETEAAKSALAALRDSRARLIDMLADGSAFAGDNPTEFDRSLVLKKRKAIEAAISDLERTVGNDVQTAVDGAARLASVDLQEAAGIPLRVDPNVLAYVQATAGDQVKDWTDRFGAKLRGLTTQVFAGGLSFRDYMSEVRKAMGPDGAEHAVDRIVRTETNRAYQQQRAAGDEALAADGADLIRVWVTQLDLRVRDSHAAIHGQERELDQPFSVGRGATDATPPGGAGFQANGPLDPSLPAEEAINCRCDVLYVPREEAQQPYIRKVIAAAIRRTDFRRYLAARGWRWPLPRLS